MVSPHAEPRELLQRKLLAEARAGAGAGPPPPFAVGQPKLRTATSAPSSRKENGRPSAKENDGSRPRPRGPTTSTTTMSPNRNGNLAVGAMRTKEALSKSVTSASAPPSTNAESFADDCFAANYPARELYDATWRTLDNALSVSTTAALEALPNPSPQPPRVFITSWVDYTHKYGTAYSLTDGSSGLYYNDSTTMVLSPDKVYALSLRPRRSCATSLLTSSLLAGISTIFPIGRATSTREGTTTSRSTPRTSSARSTSSSTLTSTCPKPSSARSSGPSPTSGGPRTWTSSSSTTA